LQGGNQSGDIVAAPYRRTALPGVYRRGNRYVVTYTDPAGRRRKRSARTIAEARLLKAELTTDVARGEFREHSRVRFDEYARQWIRTYQGRTGRGIRPTTVEEYRRDLEIHAIPYFGRRLLTDIDPRHVKLLAKALADGGRAPGTVRVIIAPLRALFATAVDEGLLRSNPCAGLRLAGHRPMDEDEPERARALTPEELARLVAATDPEWRLLMRFLAQTGLRIGELIALRWSDVDLDARRVRVRRRLYMGTLDTPKSRYGRRDVPISRRLADDLATARAATR
jgi:integrase